MRIPNLIEHIVPRQVFELPVMRAKFKGERTSRRPTGRRSRLYDRGHAGRESGCRYRGLEEITSLHLFWG